MSRNDLRRGMVLLIVLWTIVSVYSGTWIASSWATGASFTGWIVTETVPIAVPP